MTQNPTPDPAASLPAPLVPADCDLRALAYMPLLVDRLRQSRAWIRARRQPELGYYMTNLWSRSWHSLPAASLEDDDAVLAELAMCDHAHWPAVREKALSGWVKCADGRLYHPVVAEVANNAWAKCRDRRASLAKARAAKAAKQAAPEPSPEPTPEPPPGSAPTPQPAPRPEPDEAVPEPLPLAARLVPPPLPLAAESRDSADSSVTELKVESERFKKERGELRSPRTRARACGRACRPDAGFDEFWSKYPAAEGQRAARVEWDAALGRGASAGEILRGLAQHRFASSPRWIKTPANWLAAECWRSPGVNRESGGNGYLQLLVDALKSDDGLEFYTPPQPADGAALAHVH